MDTFPLELLWSLSLGETILEAYNSTARIMFQKELFSKAAIKEKLEEQSATAPAGS